MAISAQTAAGRVRPEWLLLTATMLWGTSWLPLRHLTQAAPGGAWVIGLSYGLAGLPAFYYLWVQRAALRGGGGRLLLIALCGSWANLALMLSLAQGAQLVRLMLLFYLTPVWGVLAGRLFLGEPLGGRRIVAVVCAVCGLAAILGLDGGALAPLSRFDALALSGGLAFTAANVFTRASPGLPLASKTFSVLAVSAGLALTLAVAQRQTPPALVPGLLGALAGFGLLWVLAATLAAQYAVSRLESGRASVLLVSELIVAVLSAAWLGERAVAPREWLGAGLIVLAALCETSTSTPKGAA